MQNVRRYLRPEQLRELSLVFLLIVTVVFFSTQIDGFFSGRTFSRISTTVAIIAVVAIGETLVILTRNIDLSVGSIVGFTAYFVGTQLVNHNSMPPLAAIALAICVGGTMGLINGVVVSYGRVPSIIVTLGTLAIYRTLLVNYSNAKTVLTRDLPEWLLDLPRANLFKVGELDFRLMVGVALALVVVFQLIVTYLPFGRRLYAIGSNPEAARMAGFPMQRIILTAYVVCGMLSGFAGFMFLARFGNITVVAGQGMELSAIAAVVVGGVNIFGGSGTMIGALLGALMINTLEQSLIRWLQISEFWRDALLGLLILMAVATDAVIIDRLRKFWARSGMHYQVDSAPLRVQEKYENKP